MFNALVKLKDQDAQLFGIPNAGHVKALSTMENVEWVIGPINSAGILVGSVDNISLGREPCVYPVYPPAKEVHVCHNYPSGVLSKENVQKIVQYLREQRKIMAIKEVRLAY